MTNRKSNATTSSEPTSVPKSTSSRATKAPATRTAALKKPEQPLLAQKPKISPSPEKAAAAPTATKAEKSDAFVKKPKLVRDSFTLPESDYALFKEMKARCLKGGVEAKKTEILRAALHLLAHAKDEQLLDAVRGLERIKTGRPKK